MDGRRFDALTRALATPLNRRRALAGLVAMPIGLAWSRNALAQGECPANQVFRRKLGCVCETTGRPPVDGTCPCRNGKFDCGGHCVDLQRDSGNCGGCGSVCPTDRPYCVGGQCVACRRNADCDDGVACTADTCVGGVCRFTPDHAVCEDGNPCTTNRCDPVAGCVASHNDGATCEDGDRCTTGDVCRGGVCQRGEPTSCGGLSDACNDGACDPATGLCVAYPAREGDDCDPGDPCLELGTCRAGRCVGYPIDCSGLDGDCTVGSCDSVAGGCVARPINNGGACVPSAGCFEPATCVDGACLGEPVDCSLIGEECATGVCDDETGVCRLEALPNGTVCGGGRCCAGSCCSEVCSISGTCVDCLPSGSVACREDADCCGDLVCGGDYPTSRCLCRAENHGPCSKDSDCCGDLVCDQDGFCRSSCVGHGQEGCNAGASCCLGLRCFCMDAPICSQTMCLP